MTAWKNRQCRKCLKYEEGKIIDVEDITNKNNMQDMRTMWRETERIGASSPGGSNVESIWACESISESEKFTS